MSETKNFLTKKVIIVVAILAVGALSAVLVVSSLAQAIAQEQQEGQQRRMMIWAGEGFPQINGSVSVANETTNFINENVNVSFVEAAQTAQGQVTNGTVFGGHLGTLQGYLAYTFLVTEIDNQTGHLVVVDPGNGNVLFTSAGQSFDSFGHQMPFGVWGGHGHGGIGQWHGPGKPHWFGGGMWN
jgi:type II secretory pathway pseudopilin PulG